MLQDKIQQDQKRIIENRKMEAKFIDAVKRKELEVWYQPKYDMETGELWGAEALVRWRQKDGKYIVDIDDFGIGSSTLNALYVANFDTLKLDKSFIDKIGDPKMNKIIQCTIKMAQALHMKIIAEGVETETQRQFLIENECTLAQGYYFSPPVHAQEYFLMNAPSCTLDKEENLQ